MAAAVGVLFALGVVAALCLGARSPSRLELEPGQRYRRLVLQVPDPRAESLRLAPAVGAYTGAFSR